MTNPARDAALTSLFLDMDLRANNGGSPQQYKLMCLAALATLTKQDREEVPLAWKRVVGGARRHGASWEDVARVLQMTPEGAKRLWSADLPGPYRLDVIDSASEGGVDDYLALIASAPGFTGEDILSFLVSSSQLEAPSRRSRLQNTLQALAQIAHAKARPGRGDGSRVYAHFGIDAQQVQSEEVQDLRDEAGGVEELTDSGETVLVARLSPQSRARSGERPELWLDANKLHFFDADSGAALTHTT